MWIWQSEFPSTDIQLRWLVENGKKINKKKDKNRTHLSADGLCSIATGRAKLTHVMGCFSSFISILLTPGLFTPPSASEMDVLLCKVTSFSFPILFFPLCLWMSYNCHTWSANDNVITWINLLWQLDLLNWVDYQACVSWSLQRQKERAGQKETALLRLFVFV